MGPREVRTAGVCCVHSTDSWLKASRYVCSCPRLVMRFGRGKILRSMMTSDGEAFSGPLRHTCTVIDLEVYFPGHSEVRRAWKSVHAAICRSRAGAYRRGQSRQGGILELVTIVGIPSLIMKWLRARRPRRSLCQVFMWPAVISRRIIGCE